MVISEEIAAQINCCISDYKHIVNEPVLITICGGNACKSCIKSSPRYLIKCFHCKKEHEKEELLNMPINPTVKVLIEKTYLKDLIEDLKEKNNCDLNELKPLEDDIKSRFEFIENEIDIRFESLIADLQDLRDNLKHELLKCEQKILSSEFVQALQENLKQRKTLFAQSVESYLDFIKLQQILKEYNEYYQKMIKKIKKVKFFESDETLNETIIGKISFSENSMSVEEIFKNLTNCEHAVININSSTSDICVLPNNTLVSANQDNGLTLHNENLEILKTIKTFDEKHISPCSLALNRRNEIYISDGHNRNIIMTNLELEKIKSIKYSDINDWSTSYGMCCKNDFLYVCDNSDKQRIHVLNLDLEYIDFIKLDYCPWKIKITENTFCIAAVQNLYFYDLTNFKKLTLKKQHNLGLGKISEIDSNFFQFNYQLRKLYCFNEDGLLINEISLENLKSLISDAWDGCLACLNGKLIISFKGQQKFAQF